ncbi:hypothetical protein INT45_010585, partial [Circinella minor]
CKSLLSQHLSKGLIKKISIVKPVQYDVCPNGCYMYTDSSISNCPHCNSLRFKPSRNDKTIPMTTTHQLPLSQHLGSYFQSPALRHLMGYRWRQSVQTTMKDIFDGTAYLSMRDQLFKQPEDIAIGLFTDGFNVFKKRSYTITLVMATILNLPPEERYILSIFIQPLLSELAVLQDHGMVVHTPAGKFESKVHLLFTGGDIPAVGTGGDNGGMFFLPTAETPAIREKSSFIASDLEHQLKVKTPLAKLKAFQGPLFFLIDEIHLLGHNIGHQIWNAIRGKKYGKKNPFALQRKYHKIIGQKMAMLKSKVPITFEDQKVKLCTKFTVDLHQQPGYARAVDWIVFILYIVPTYIVEHLDKQQQKCRAHKKKNPRVLEQAKLALVALSKVYELVLQYEIEPQDIQEIERHSYLLAISNIQIWHTFLNAHMPTNFFTINQHYLTHLPECIKKYGNPRMYSARPMERMIGMLKPRINSRTKPASNASNVMIEMVTTTQFFHRCVSTNETSEDQQIPVDDLSHERTQLIMSKTIVTPLDDENTATATLRQLQQKSMQDFKNNDYDIESLLINYYSRYNIDYSNLDDMIYTGKQVIVRGHVFSGSNDFVKLTWPVDENARRGLGSADALEWGDMFGTILLLFSHVN